MTHENPLASPVRTANPQVNPTKIPENVIWRALDREPYRQKPLFPLVTQCFQGNDSDNPRRMSMPKKRGGGGGPTAKAAGIPKQVMKKAGKALGTAPAMKKATTATAVKAMGRRATTPTKKAVKAIRTTRKKGY